MAERRMFSKTVIDSDAFLDMPLSAQALYFHLSMWADDDGFVNNPKKILRSIGASADDAGLLTAKRFIITFESGAVVIRHWKMHNYVRKDTYSETIFKEEKAMLSLDENNVYVVSEEKSPASTTRQRPVDGTSTTRGHRIGKDSIGKDSIGKDSIGKDSIGKENPEEIYAPAPENLPDYNYIIDAFNSICVDLPKVQALTESRKQTIKGVKACIDKLGGFEELFKKVQQSDFLCGRGGGAWSSSFDWIIKHENAIKIFEGNYDNSASHGKTAAEKTLADIDPPSYDLEKFEEMALLHTPKC